MTYIVRKVVGEQEGMIHTSLATWAVVAKETGTQVQVCESKGEAAAVAKMLNRQES